MCSFSEGTATNDFSFFQPPALDIQPIVGSPETVVVDSAPSLPTIVDSAQTDLVVDSVQSLPNVDSVQSLPTVSGNNLFTSVSMFT